MRIKGEECKRKENERVKNKQTESGRRIKGNKWRMSLEGKDKDNGWVRDKEKK